MFALRRSLTGRGAGLWPRAAAAAGGRGPRTEPRRQSSGRRLNVPPSAEFVARVTGIPTMAKLPHRESADGLDAAFVGVPIDTGTSNRPGARWCFFSFVVVLSLPVARSGAVRHRHGCSYCLQRRVSATCQEKVKLICRSENRSICGVLRFFGL